MELFSNSCGFLGGGRTKKRGREPPSPILLSLLVSLVSHQIHISIGFMMFKFSVGGRYSS